VLDLSYGAGLSPQILMKNGYTPEGVDLSGSMTIYAKKENRIAWYK